MVSGTWHRPCFPTQVPSPFQATLSHGVHCMALLVERALVPSPFASGETVSQARANGWLCLTVAVRPPTLATPRCTPTSPRAAADVFAGGVVYPIVEKLEVKDPTKDPLFPVYRGGWVRHSEKSPLPARWVEPGPLVKARACGDVGVKGEVMLPRRWVLLIFFVGRQGPGALVVDR